MRPTVIAARTSVRRDVSGLPPVAKDSPLFVDVALDTVRSSRTLAYEVQGTVFYSRYKDSFTLFSGLFVIALSIFANVTLIPLFALNGAASAIVVSYGAGIVARQIMITSYFR